MATRWHREIHQPKKKSRCIEAYTNISIVAISKLMTVENYFFEEETCGSVPGIRSGKSAQISR
jgi:hypothetical protein